MGKLRLAESILKAASLLVASIADAETVTKQRKSIMIKDINIRFNLDKREA